MYLQMNNIHVFFLPEKISSKDRQCHMLVEPFCGLTNSPAVFFMSVKKALHISKQSLLVMTMVPSWVFRLLSTTTTFMTCSRSHRNPWTLSTIRRSSYSFSNSFWDDHNNLMKFGASHLKTISRSLYLKLISVQNMACMTSPHDEQINVIQRKKFPEDLFIKAYQLFRPKYTLFGFSFFHILFVERKYVSYMKVELFRNLFFKLVCIQLIELFIYIHEDIWRVFHIHSKTINKMKTKPPTDFSVMMKKPHLYKISFSFCEHLYTFLHKPVPFTHDLQSLSITWRFLSHDLYLYPLINAFILFQFSFHLSHQLRLSLHQKI